jgi:hypothetical protein
MLLVKEEELTRIILTLPSLGLWIISPLNSHLNDSKA